MQKQPLTLQKIFVFWVPLAATWLMMAVEGPFLAAIIARLQDPKYNLAAYGVAFSMAVLVEAPIIMIMSASTALVKDKSSFIKLRNFTYVLNSITTVIMIVLVLPPVFFFVTQRIIGLPENVSRLTHTACLILLPWPGAIGYRRFYQGILISSNLTRRVAYGTIVRLASMASIGLICYLFFHFNGAAVGALALTFGVTAEAVASKIMVRASVRDLLSLKRKYSFENQLSYRSITKFYYPLALTSILGLGIHPMVTFFMGQSRLAIESLAVWPVVGSLVFIFRSLGLSFQEVSIALLGENNEGYRPLRNFAVLLGFGVTAALSIVALTPLSFLWFHKISGLSLELTGFAVLPTKILTVIPGLMVLISFQRAIMVNNRKTKHVTIATSIEVLTIIVLLSISIRHLNWVGAIAAALSVVIGRLMANTYLFFPSFRMRRGPAQNMSQILKK